MQEATRKFHGRNKSVLTQVADGWLRGDYKHFSMRWEKIRRGDYTYRYLVLVTSRTTAAIVSSAVVCAVP